MEIVPFSEKWKTKLWEYILRFIPDFHHIVGRLEKEGEIFTIHLAINEKQHIKGTMTLFYGLFAEIRGSEEAIEKLINILPKKTQMINIYEEYKHLLIENYPNPLKSGIDIFFSMSNQELATRVRFSPKLIEKKTRDEICELLNRADPEEWGSLEPQDIPMGPNWSWYGIWEKDKLTCLGSMTLDKCRGTITYIATCPEQRNKGLATSMVSFLLKKIFAKVDLALVNARERNDVAIHVYRKVGFEPYRKFYWMKLK